MSFQCPQCSQSSLKIVKSIELAPDSRSDEISLQVVRCQDCKYEGLAVYEESSRGALDAESIDHYGYSVNREMLREIKSLISRCPQPRNARCDCSSHQKLNLHDKSGRWIKPGLEVCETTYPIQR
ncbi:MAG: hypothetical protein ACK2UE_17145 [Anaerolineales bacterium]|jgi:hypothetical protein